ncbi:unnamed protein product [Rhizoctonia solani]|uniref:WLM domain-containing protein n=1 Tax=Rhizoctonia solani TaxID=456999 RepID=A0A8H3DPT1_9AGAM|nr:unnamed protein product [Rhizoctonia solani]
MPLHRFNTKTSSPNPYFNFITVLPSYTNAPSLPSQDDAQKLLEALAAQVRPLCKKHGFNVNSFEEYNTVFLGRNWNAGETIEIVLRRSDGSFHNVQHLIQVVCHELAHIKHMNHLAGFQQLNTQLCHDVAALRTKGYYGDGMYSSGARLCDSAEIAGRGLGASDFDLPEYMCGGAQDRRRASTLRRAPRQNGAPKQKRRKAGTRVTSKYAFVGEGNALNAHITGDEQKKKGTGFGKRAQSAKERQARLEATERRLKSLEKNLETKPTSEPDLDSDSDSEPFKETDELRRKLLADSGTGWKFPTVPDAVPSTSFGDDIINLISDDEPSGSGRPKTPPKPKLAQPKKPASQKPGPSLINMASLGQVHCIGASFTPSPRNRPIMLGAAALASTVSANPWILPEGYHRFAPRSSGFSWGDCGTEAPSSRECSRFEVPLDWANESAGKGSLAVARYKATKQPKLGTLFINPGGPGGSGVDTILGTNAERISAIAGGQYDIVSWDPRGIGLTMPRADCFKTGTEENAFWEGTIPRAGLEARGNFTDQYDIDQFYEQVDEVDVLLEKLGKQCVAYSPDTFQYIGTAAAVRDMVAMHDALEGVGKPIDYWGLSYGTVIGIYFVNMFPDRVGRVVLDGVVDPEYWANRPAHEMWWIKPESTDEALTGFVEACAAAGPSGCALATKGATSDSIRQLLRNLIDAAYDYKRAVGKNAEFGSATLRMLLFKGMYTPTQWPDLAEQGAQLVAAAQDLSLLSNSTHVKRLLRAPLVDIDRRQSTTNVTNDRDPAPDYAFQGVTCADAIDAGNVTTKDVFDFLVKVTREVSQMFGPLFNDGGLYCHRWPVRAVERYTGPWNKKLANPILVIGNEADPVTPYKSAKKVADALGDSAILIEQDDYGHLSLAMHSDCTISALTDYFLNNKLPSQDKLCGTEQVLFPGPGVTKTALAKLNSENLSANPSTLQDELEKARARGNNLFIVVIALAAAAGLLLLGLVFSCIRGRRGSKATHTTYIPRGAFEKGGDEQGHTYSDPYIKGAAVKSGGYSRVET